MIISTTGAQEVITECQNFPVGRLQTVLKFHRQSRNFPDLQKHKVMGLSRPSFQSYAQKPSGRAKTFWTRKNIPVGNANKLTIFLGLCDNDKDRYDNDVCGGGGVCGGLILM